MTIWIVIPCLGTIPQKEPVHPCEIEIIQFDLLGWVQNIGEGVQGFIVHLDESIMKIRKQVAAYPSTPGEHVKFDFSWII